MEKPTVRHRIHQGEHLLCLQSVAPINTFYPVSAQRPAILHTTCQPAKDEAELALYEAQVRSGECDSEEEIHPDHSKIHQGKLYSVQT